MDLQGRFPLHDAVTARDFFAVQSLVLSGYDVNSLYFDRVTPLHIACLNGDVDMSRYLLERGAWVNAQSIDNSTPLCEACAGGSAECVRLLLQFGADVNPPLLLSTPLHEAALRGRTDVVSVLLSTGAKVDVNDLHYGTPLHAVCSMQMAPLECIQVLLRAGANVNAIKTHKTPLHLIAGNSQCVSAAELLVAHGANVYLRDSFGRTARDLVDPRTDLAQLLTNYESQPRPLSHHCRLKIRSQLGPSRLPLIQQLEIPALLLSYLL